MNTLIDRHFKVVVAGENHEEIMKKYDSSLEVEPYTAYYFNKAADYKDLKIKMYQEVLNSGIIKNEEFENGIKNTIEDLKAMDDMDFFLELTDGLEIDEKTGDALTTKNPNGKYDSCSIAKVFSEPFINKDGVESFSSRKGDISFYSMENKGKTLYEDVWETVMEGKKPETDVEQRVYENMKERTMYLELFGTKENYVKTCTAFWGLAFVSEKDGWVEISDNDDQFEWARNFYDRFIANLPDKTLLTIYECFRK